jgi:transposase
MKPDLMLSELCGALNREYQIDTSERTISREMKRRGLTYKKAFYHFLSMVLLLTYVLGSETSS